MTDPSAFSKLVPGFDFLQGLVKNAGAALPGIGQWVAPTIDPAELEKRIEELRTVQFWLEQNARMLGATIQALEVQRMTLSTLKTMNVQMEGLRDSLQVRVPTVSPPPPAPARETAAPPPEPAEPAAAAAAPAPAPGVVDPLQWWGALTQQFTELATTAMKDTASDAARKLAGATLKGSLDPAAKATAPATKRKAAATKKPAAGKKAATRR
ncbi:MAG: PhaM family polyhydroxyalkanoate granule multifunctional regulatory protein [Pseudomonadota bacterium]